jgi:hypothetical protein
MWYNNQDLPACFLVLVFALLEIREHVSLAFLSQSFKIIGVEFLTVYMVKMH